MPMIKVPMDEELYEAAERVMDEIDAKLAADRNASPEAVLGRSLADAYERWHSMLIAKYTNTPSDTPPESTKKRRFDTGGHPWRTARAVVPKRER